MNTPTPDRDRALAAICCDLDRERGQRRRHFTPALLMAIVVVVGVLAILGLRPDFTAQPDWQIAVQLVSWVVVLLVFPAIGVGLWFPSRTTRVLLAAGGVAASIVAATGLPDASPEGPAGGGPCWMVLAGCGLILLGLGALSGAFSQRRAQSAGYWIAAGLTLAALDVVTWICPNTQTQHLLTMHFAPAFALVVVAAVLGAWLHRRSRSKEAHGRLS